MGYMDLSVQGSDMAAGCAEEVGNAMAKVLSKEFRTQSNEYNTDGPINVAMIFEEVICPNDVFKYNDKLQALAKRVVKAVEKQIKASEKTPSAEWDSKGMHLRRYRQMVRRIEAWLTD